MPTPNYDDWKLATPWDHIKPCRRCDDTREITCRDCDGEGRWEENHEEIECEVCHGKGVEDCPDCT